jgi:hypothetical protein
MPTRRPPICWPPEWAPLTWWPPECPLPPPPPPPLCANVGVLAAPTNNTIIHVKARRGRPGLIGQAWADVSGPIAAQSAGRQIPGWRRWGSGWWWRRVRCAWVWTRAHEVSGHGDFMSFRVHALKVGVIVAPLQAIRGALCGASTCQGPYCEPGACSHGSAAAAAYGCAGCGADHRADCGTLDPAVRGGLTGRSAADLYAGILPAFKIVGPKLVEALAGTRQRHHPGTGGHRRARANHQHR